MSSHIGCSRVQDPYSLRCIPQAPGFTVVDAGGQIDLALAADLAGLALETLYQYNPAFNRWRADHPGCE